MVVDIERDPEKPQNVPVKVSLTERPAREIGIALGYGTDSGARGEVAGRYRNLFGRGYDLQSAIRVDRGSQIGYADVYLPPSLTPLNLLNVMPSDCRLSRPSISSTCATA